MKRDNYFESDTANRVTSKDNLNPITDKESVIGFNTYDEFKTYVERIFISNPEDEYAIIFLNIHGLRIEDAVLQKYNKFLCDDNILAYTHLNKDKLVFIERYTTQTHLIFKWLKGVDNLTCLTDIICNGPKIIVFAGAYIIKPHETLSIDAIVDRAQLAQNQQKLSGNTGITLYHEEYATAMIVERDIGNQMELALQNGEFVVYLQPKFNIAENKIVSAEALVRWITEEHGIMSPQLFIPVFEQNGFIKQLDTYVFKTVCQLIRKWLDQRKKVIPISVNLSKVQMMNSKFLDEYIYLKNKYQIDNEVIEIEFTESMIIEDTEKIHDIMCKLKQNGFCTSIDDFGSGYSALNLLAHLPADFLKLDKVFLDKGGDLIRKRIVISNVITMAKELSMKIVAEGIEEPEQLEFLKSVGCEMAQGYLFDKPLPISRFEEKYILNDTNNV